MISLEDCIAFSGLSENEVAAIGEHEHIPTIAASALADYLLKQPHGGEKIRAMIIDDIHEALCKGRIKHAQELFMARIHVNAWLSAYLSDHRVCGESRLK
jgi:hypothetical protein